MITIFAVVLLMILATTLVVAAHGVDTEREKLNKRLNPKPGLGRRRKK